MGYPVVALQFDKPEWLTGLFEAPRPAHSSASEDELPQPVRPRADGQVRVGCAFVS